MRVKYGRGKRTREIRTSEKGVESRRCDRSRLRRGNDERRKSERGKDTSVLRREERVEKVLDKDK